MNDARNEVLWFCAAPTPATKREFEQRGRTIRLGDTCRPLDRIQQVSSVVASLDDRSEVALCKLLRLGARRFVDSASALRSSPPTTPHWGACRQKLTTAMDLPGTRVRTSPDAASLAESAARHNAGEIPGLDLKITVAGTQSCPIEYQTAVAVQLLHRCEWDSGPPADRFRRGYGCRVAVALTADLVGERDD